MAKAAPELAPIIELARNVNDSMPNHVAQRIRNIVNPGSKVLILGCTYKPDWTTLGKALLWTWWNY